MKVIVTLCAIICTTTSFAKTEKICDTTFRFEIEANEIMAQNMPIYVQHDSRMMILSQPIFDQYFKVFHGELRPVKNSIEDIYPRIVLKVVRTGHINDSLNQVRLLDIEEMHILKSEPHWKFGNRPCEDQIILNQGDTIQCTFNRFYKSEVEYMPCGQRNNVKSEYLVDVLKIIEFNGSQHLYADKTGKHKKRKQKKEFVGKAFAATIALLGLSALAVVLVQTGD